MKLLKSVLAVAAVAAGSLGAMSANAIQIGFGVPYAGNPTFLGTLSPVTGDLSTYESGELSGAFTQYWFFEINPAGLGSVSATFNPFTAVNGFDVSLHVADTSACGAFTLGGGYACVTTSGSEIVGDQGASNDGLVYFTFEPLTSGYYIFTITGTATAGTSGRSYAGNVSVEATPTPEPGSLALLGLGLVSLGLARRKRA